MNNKPVAWTDKRQLSRPYPHSDAMTMWANSYPEQGIDIPLYTQPVKELTDEEIRELGRMSRKWQDPYVWLAKRINRPLKDLTNKEIQEVITEHEWYGWTLEQFAKAILRKAQEK